MNLANLKERTTFIFGDLNYPTPGKLCLIKFTDNYLNRINRKFNTKYIVGELKLVNNKPFIFFKTTTNKYSANYKEISCTWSNNIIENWYYIEDIEKFLK